MDCRAPPEARHSVQTFHVGNQRPACPSGEAYSVVLTAVGS